MGNPPPLIKGILLKLKEGGGLVKISNNKRDCLGKKRGMNLLRRGLEDFEFCKRVFLSTVLVSHIYSIGLLWLCIFEILEKTWKFSTENSLKLVCINKTNWGLYVIFDCSYLLYLLRINFCHQIRITVFFILITFGIYLEICKSLWVKVKKNKRGWNLNPEKRGGVEEFLFSRGSWA